MTIGTEKPEYKILISPEELKLEKLRNTLKCFACHLWISKDSSGHIFPFTGCHECPQIDFCRRLRVLIEQEMNGGGKHY